jgi:hypothetical protein
LKTFLKPASNLLVIQEAGMTVHVRLFEVKGSVEDVERLLPQLGKAMNSPAVETEADDKDVAEDAENDKPPLRLATDLTVELAKAVLIRRPPLTESHEALLLTLHKAYPKLIGWKALCAEMAKRTKKQPKGAIGSFGRRVNQTRGIRPGMSFFVREAAAGEEHRYGLVDAARTAVEELGLRTGATGRPGSGRASRLL